MVLAVEPKSAPHP